MKIRKSVISLVAAATLFTACGGGGGGGGGSGSGGGVVDTTLPTIVAPSSYDVVAGSRKAITLALDKPNIGATGVLYEYAIVDKPSSVKLIDKNRGVITYSAPADPTSITFQVTVQVLDAEKQPTGQPSAPFAVTFNTIAKPVTVAVKPYPTTKVADDYNKTTDNAFNVVDPRGLIWEDNTVGADPAEIFGYDAAVNHCTRDTDGEGWRLPTRDELLDLVDYSKAADPNPIIPAAFTQVMGSIWSQKEDGRFIQFSESSGMFSYTTSAQRLPVRCVKGNEAPKHIIHSEKFIDYTYDETTKLEWAPAQPAGTVCSAFTSIHGHNGYRVPTINELRSVMENGNISDLITQGKTPLYSSTPYVDANGATDGVWQVQLGVGGFNDKFEFAGFGNTPDDKYVFCVRDMI